jgi:diguanylate cyclase (GGDEF)-like protein
MREAAPEASVSTLGEMSVESPRDGIASKSATRRGSPRLARPRPEVRVAILAGLVAIVSGAGLALPWLDLDHSWRNEAAWALPTTILLFGVFEYAVFNLHFRGEPVSVALGEVPIALAIVFLSPPVAVLARIPLAIAVLVLLRRNPWFKVVFNLSVFVFEVVLASVVYWALIRWWGDSLPGVVSASTLAVVVLSPASVVLVSAAIAQFGGGFGSRVVTELRTTWWISIVNSGVAAMVVGLAVISPPLGLLGVAPLFGMWYLQWHYGEQIQRLRDLDAVHGFAGRVGGTLDLAEIGDTAAAETQRLLRAQGAALVRFEGGVAADTHLVGDVPLALPIAIDSPGWESILASPGARLMSADALRQEGVFESSGAPVIVAPIHDDEGAQAVLVAVARLEQSHRFDASDVSRLDNLAGQLATSLRRGLLHERLEYEARHDALTDLPNRTLFERLVTDAVAGYDASRTVSVLMLDLDRFKEVNDTLGHHAGDAVLIAFAERVVRLLGPDDVLSRLAGDEFALLCARPSVADVAAFANEVVRVAGEPVTVDDLEIVVTASLGAAVITSSDRDAVQPMRRADIAMYNAKWQRSGVEFYRDEIDRRTPARLSMLGDLRNAIHSDQLDVVYQPKLSIATGQVLGLEALVRWTHPTRGMVPPIEFVRVAEDTGLIKELTDLVLSRGIAQLADLRAAGLATGIAVNVSTHDLFDSRLPERVRGYLDAHHLPADTLTLEITESSLFVDAPRTRATIDGLHAVGLRMAIDDFGTGYSSLAYLRQLPVHELKIDGSFVTGMLADAQDEVIVRSTIDLGHNLGLKVVAEGVESFAVLRRLSEIGCDIAQGFCISEPIAAPHVAAWLRRVGTAVAEGEALPWSAAIGAAHPRFAPRVPL